MFRLFALLLLLSPVILLADDVYQSQQDFLQEAFLGDPPPAGVLWLRDGIRTASTEILGHPYPGLRIRYWMRDG